MDLEGKNVFITGAAHRIGRIIAPDGGFPWGQTLFCITVVLRMRAKETALEVKNFGSQALLVQQDLANVDVLKNIVMEISKKMAFACSGEQCICFCSALI